MNHNFGAFKKQLNCNFLIIVTITGPIALNYNRNLIKYNFQYIYNKYRLIFNLYLKVIIKSTFSFFRKTVKGHTYTVY